MNTQTHKVNNQGHLVPIEMIKPIDLARDDLVMEIVGRSVPMSIQLHDLKKGVFDDIQAFIELSAEQYGVRVGGNKGNVTLMSFDGKYKVIRAIQEHITFDERLQAAKALIDECLIDWTKESGPEIQAIIERAFEVNKEGQLNTGRILALRRVNIKDSRWLKAMEAISESTQVVGSKSYFRVYQREGNTDVFKPISLDIAGV